ncbi:MAG: hypothetical protein NTX22_16835 [Ignavibacteriales bacterium]|nr:hypothetical protein [Ignavibacteriales bacterium]
MDRIQILEQLKKEASLLDQSKLREVFNFIKYLKHREKLDPTLEILSTEEDYKKVKRGLQEKKEGKMLDWNLVK